MRTERDKFVGWIVVAAMVAGLTFCVAVGLISQRDGLESPVDAVHLFGPI